MGDGGDFGGVSGLKINQLKLADRGDGWVRGILRVLGSGGFDEGADFLVPDFVAGGVHVQAVFLEEVFAGFAVGVEHFLGDVQEFDVGVLLVKIADHRVGALHLRPEFEAGDAGLDADEDDFCVGEGGVDFGDELFE